MNEFLIEKKNLEAEQIRLEAEQKKFIAKKAEFNAKIKEFNNMSNVELAKELQTEQEAIRKDRESIMTESEEKKAAF